MGDLILGYVVFSYLVMGMFAAIMRAPILARVSSLIAAPITMPVLIGAVLGYYHNKI